MRHTGSTRGPFCVHVFDVYARPVTLVRAAADLRVNDRIPFRPTVFDTLRDAAEALKEHPYFFDGFQRAPLGWTASGPAMHAKAHLASDPCPATWTDQTAQARLPGAR